MSERDAHQASPEEPRDRQEPKLVGPASLRLLDDIEILRLPYLAIAEARRRGLLSTWDLPSGGYAEALAHLVFGGTAHGAAGKGHDLTDGFGSRIEVKAVVAGRHTSPAHPQNFDVLCLLRLDPATLDVDYAVTIPSKVVLEIGRPHPRGGVRVFATKNLPQRTGVEDLTDVFRATATGVCAECGAAISNTTGEPTLEIVRAHQRIWH